MSVPKLKSRSTFKFLFQIKRRHRSLAKIRNNSKKTMKNREKAMKMFDSQNFLLFASGLGFLVEFKWKSCFGGEKKNWREREKKAEIGNVAAADFHFYFVSCRCVRLRVWVCERRWNSLDSTVVTAAVFLLGRVMACTRSGGCTLKSK